MQQPDVLALDLVFPKVQQLDLTGPLEVFASLSEAEVRLGEINLRIPDQRPWVSPANAARRNDPKTHPTSLCM